MTDKAPTNGKGPKSPPRTGPFRLLTLRMLLAIWLGVPFIVALASYNSSSDLQRNSSIYRQALIKPRYVMSGIIERPDPRGRHLSLKSAEGNRRIFCDLGIGQSDCLFGNRFPISARVEMFNYDLDKKEFPILLSAMSNDGVILSEKEQLFLLKDTERRSRERNIFDDIFKGFLFGTTFSFFVTIFMIAIGWLVKSRNEGAN